jgi:hypothetical protein
MVEILGDILWFCLNISFHKREGSKFLVPSLSVKQDPSTHQLGSS